MVTVVVAFAPAEIWSLVAGEVVPMPMLPLEIVETVPVIFFPKMMLPMSS